MLISKNWLATSLQKIKIVHVEAGLRSFDDTMPEEINRKLIDQMSDILFSPTKFDYDNLRRDNCLKSKKTLVGLVVVGLVLLFFAFSLLKNL